MSGNALQGDDPPYLSVGTEVSAKYKGAFCEAKIRKVVRSVKCRVTYKHGLGTATVTDDQIKGNLRVGSVVEARHNEKKDFVEATITKIQDCSQYTVVFDDGDITTLRRTALCLKSGRHFAESETLDQLPLTHPEHFCNPVIGGRRGRRRAAQDGSSDEEDDDGGRGSNDSESCGKEGRETEPEIGKVVCVELGDKKKKDNWFPGLVVSPNAQDTVKIRVRDDYLVRSFKDARYYTVPKKEATEFTKDLVNKVENVALKVAVEKALLFLEKNELPPHWDRDVLFGNTVSSENSDSDGDLDSDSSDDEPREEKDHFVAQLYKFMDDCATPINNCPMIGDEDIDLYRLFRAVYKLGGYNRVTNQNQWKIITRRLGFNMQNNPSTHNLVKQAYKKFLHSFEDFYRKLGCTMVNHPRGAMRKQRPGRSLIRDKDRNTPVPQQPEKVQVKTEKEDEDKNKKTAEEEKKREVKKEIVVKEEEVKIKKKEEPTVDESVSGQESDLNNDGEESSSSEISQRSLSRLTPSSNVSNRSKATAKDATKKKPSQDKKPPKRQDKKDEKSKEEDSTKTRSKATKEESSSKGTKASSESRDTRTPSREAENKKTYNAKQKKFTDEDLKKRGRKKKEVEGERIARGQEESHLAEYSPVYKGPVEVNDRLKVYYGPTHEHKVTYEAKVLDIDREGSEPIYFVHYTGWNTRYDEWIKGSIIAHNFTQALYTQGRVKRSKTTPRPQTPSVSSSSTTKGTKTTSSNNSSTSGTQGRRRAQNDPPTSLTKDIRKDDRESTPATNRTTTPSPMRTKSPATTGRTTRVTRNIIEPNESGRRTRKAAGVISESEESDSIDSDASDVPVFSRQRARGNRREARRRAESRMKIEESSDVEPDKDAEEPRRGRRLRKPLGKIQDIKTEPESDEEQPKGRDFDLNQIRSELKGFDKAVKVDVNSDAQENEDEEIEKPIAVKQERIETDDKKVTTEADKKPVLKVESQRSTTPIKRETIKTEANQAENTEDVYEFKEPEPFEFEVRNKRDSGGSATNDKVETKESKDKNASNNSTVNKKRNLEDDLKSPKKRQKPTSTASTNNVISSTSTVSSSCSSSSNTTTVGNTSISTINPKPESKRESESPSGDNIDNKKKTARKILKKAEEADDADTEGDDPSNFANTTTIKYYPSTNYPGATVIKRNIENASTENESLKSKRPAKPFTPVKSTDIKPEAPMNIEELKKRARKMFGRKTEDTHTPTAESDDSNKEQATKITVTGKSSETTAKEEESCKSIPKKRQKTVSAPTDSKVKTPTVRKVATKKGTASGDSDDSDEEPLTSRDHSKYFSQYAGPKAKAAAAIASELETVQKVADTSSNEDVSKLNEPSTSKQFNAPSVKTSEQKTLDFPTPVVPPSLIVPAPLSARLPATASIEEKLSAAAVFRATVKKEEENQQQQQQERKIPKEIPKKSHGISFTANKKIIDPKPKPEVEKKKIEPANIKKDPLQEIEIRKDPLLEVVKKKDDEMLKVKKEVDVRPQVSAIKTYQRKDAAAKIEEAWKKATSTSVISEQLTSLPGMLRKEAIVSRIKSTIERTESIDTSSDSSDSEKRLTIIDSEDFALDHGKESSSNEQKNKKSSYMEQNAPVSAAAQRELQANIMSAMMQNKVGTSKIEEDGENINSLLCNEEIPGSPTPTTESSDQDRKSSVTQVITKPDLSGTKVAVTFVTTQVPLSTTGSVSTTLTNSTIVVSSVTPVVTQSSSNVGTIPLAVKQPPVNIQQNRQPAMAQIQYSLPPPPTLPVQMSHHPVHHPYPPHQPIHPNVAMHRRENESLMESSTPPTTPDSIASNISGSSPNPSSSTPSSSIDDTSKVIIREHVEAENEAPNKEDEVRNTNETSADKTLKPPVKRSVNEIEHVVIKKRKKRNSEAGQPPTLPIKKTVSKQLNKLSKHSAGSDSDESCEQSNVHANSGAILQSPNAQSNGPHKAEKDGLTNSKLKHNFLEPLDPNLTSSQRIATWMQRINALRNLYQDYRNELASLEKRAKRIKRKNRAQKQTKASHNDTQPQSGATDR